MWNVFLCHNVILIGENGIGHLNKHSYLLLDDKGTINTHPEK